MSTLLGRVYMVITLIVPFIFVPSLYEVFELPKFLTIYVGASIVCALWIIRMISENRLIFKTTPLDVPLLLFLGTQLVATFFSIDPFTSVFGYYTRYFGGMFSLVMLALLYWGGVSNLTVKDGRKIEMLLIVSATILAVLALFERLGVSLPCLFVDGSIRADCWVQDITSRPFATLGQPNWLAAYLAMMIPFTWKTNRKYLLLSTIIFVGILVTQSRSALIGVLVAFLVYWLRNMSVKSYKYAGILLSVYAILTIIFNPFSGHTTPNADPTVTASTDIRTLVWKGAIDVWKHNALVGTGPETFAYSYFQYRPVEHNLTSEWNFIYSKAHNEYLNYLANTGIVGFAGFLLFTFATLRLLYNKPALFAGYSAFLASNFFSFTTSSTAWLMFLFPMIASLSTVKNKFYSLSANAKHLVVIVLTAAFTIQLVQLHLSPFPIAERDIKRNKDLALEYMQTRPEISLEVLSSIEPYAPTDPMIPYFSALAAINMQNINLADNFLKKALDLKPNYKEAQQAYQFIEARE